MCKVYHQRTESKQYNKDYNLNKSMIFIGCGSILASDRGRVSVELGRTRGKYGQPKRSRGSQVEGRKSRVASRGSHVEGHSLRVRKSRSRVKSKGSEYKGLYVFYRSKERSILVQTKITFFTGCCLTIAFVFSQQVPTKILRSLE